MEEVKQLKQLVDFGIPIALLARECHCSPGTIYKYLNGSSLPSGSKIMAIREGLRKLLETITVIIRE